MSKYVVGFVIPIYQDKFIRKTVDFILNTYHKTDLVVCIVNDGQESVEKYLLKEKWPQNVHIINLAENRCFAGANNAGWKYLIKNYPDIKYLGSINDDTIPKNGWLERMIIALERYPKVGLSMPIMETRLGWFKTKKNYAIWKFKKDGMVPVKYKIDKDKFSSSVNGFCFLILRKVLEEVGFLDENFKNGHEDADLGIKMLLSGYRLVVCKDSYVFHYGGASRYLGDNEFRNNAEVLMKKYNDDIEKFNNLDKDGFLIKKYDY